MVDNDDIDLFLEWMTFFVGRGCFGDDGSRVGVDGL